MKRIFILLCLASTLSLQATAQDINAIIHSVETQNTQLRAARHANEALTTALHADNLPGATSVEYSPFYQGGYDGVASSELIVSQEFDFPSLYATRHKSNRSQTEILDLQYRTLRRDILLEALQCCYDLYAARQTHLLLRDRLSAADSLLLAYDMRLRQGDASRLDLNRIKMDRMAVSTEVIRNDALIQSLQLELQRLNGGKPFDTGILDTTPNLADIVSAGADNVTSSQQPLEAALADATVRATRQELSLARQGWLPSLTLGYRRNTEQRETLNGFLVGVSVPLFSNGAKVKAAKLRRSAAEDEMANVLVEQDARLDQLQNRVEQLRLMLETYDESLMRESLMLLRRAVMAGQLTVIDYYTESDRIYSLLQERLATQNEYLKLVADIHRETL